MRALIINDVHLRDGSPSSRVDGYLDDILAKLEYCADLEKKIKADITIQAGDLFHFPAPTKTSHATMMRAMEVLSKFDNLWVVPGNHDLSQNRLDSMMEKQPLGVLVQSGIVKILDGWHPTLPVYGVPWQQDWIENEHAPDRAFKSFRDGIEEGKHQPNSLAVTHASLYPPEEQLSVIFEYIPTNGKNSIAAAMGGQGALAYGHIHSCAGKTGIFEDGGVTYCNPGALCRLSTIDYELSRKIQVAIWDSEKGFIIHEVPHKSASELFYLEEKIEKKQDQKNLEEFLSDIGSTHISISNIESVKTHISSLDIEKQVKEKAIDILSEVS